MWKVAIVQGFKRYFTKKGEKMYLHIGKNCVIKNNSVIGVFSFKNIENTKEFKNLQENLQNNIIDLSNGKAKTFILTEENDLVKGYISNIGTSTIKKRKM